MPSFTSDKRSTSPKERIIPIEIEGKSKIRHHADVSAKESKPAKQKSVIEIKPDKHVLQDKWEVKVEEPKLKKSKDSKKDTKEPKKDAKQDSKKAAKESKKVSKSDSKKDPKKDSKDSKKEPKSKSAKKDLSKEEVDENKNVIDKSKKKEKKLDESHDDSTKGSKSNKATSEHEVTITTQPGKSILKQPVASSTPLPDASHDSSWLDRSTTSTGTVVKKKTSAKSKCASWLCMPCGLCCACAPFECECCDCCYLKCSRCEQCLCQCCNRKCC